MLSYLVELLGRGLRQNNEIEGIAINGQTFVSGQFADDMILFLNFKEKSLQAAIGTLIKFNFNSGLKLNYEKSKILHIGVIKNSLLTLQVTEKFQWVSGTINVLGIDICEDRNEVD